MSMTAGQLRHRIELWKPVEERQPGGQLKIVDWTLYLRCHAKVTPLSSKEVFSAPQIQDLITHHLTIRYRPGVSDKMRVKLRDRWLNISTPPRNLNEKNVWLEFDCIEVTNAR